MKTFFNTTNETERLKEFTEKAESQHEKVLKFFQANPGKNYTPFDIHKAVFDDKVPITSVRRSLTVLTDKHLLIRLDTKQIEVYGRSNYVWTLCIFDSHGQLKIC